MKKTARREHTGGENLGQEVRVIALAGNPNVGKSTVFNGLTGMKQHTGNWPGKTVAVARGQCRWTTEKCTLVDLPGSYSLLAHSAEEEVARNFICFGEPDAVIAVCDATCLERNLNLVLQIMEVCPRVLVCVNLMDEAKRRGISVSTEALSSLLGVRVVGISARRRGDLRTLTNALNGISEGTDRHKIPYPSILEDAVAELLPLLEKKELKTLPARWVALRLIEGDPSIKGELASYLGEDLFADAEIASVCDRLRGATANRTLNDAIASAAVLEAERIAKKCVQTSPKKQSDRDRRIDRWLTSRAVGYPIMLLLLLFTFFLTVTVSNYPSAWLSSLFGFLEEQLNGLFFRIGLVDWFRELLVEGVFRTLGWVISVMLPPMAIFFPLFTLLEDSGYLPRIAYNLDRPFCKCNACGKQALTMCMGFGCNAVGVIGCRIVDSPRERLLAILTNAFVPCNGRFPALIALITMFLVGGASSTASSLLVAAALTLVILFSVLITFGVTKILSVTVLRGEPSSFTLELPSYRRPQFGRVIVRSLLDRTLFVLGRAAAVAAPAGLVIWVMANVTVGDASLLRVCSEFLDPFASLLGVDGVILLAFILGIPANEIVIPIMLMAYLSEGGLMELGNLTQMRAVLAANGWTAATAVSVMLLFLLHAPCSTTLLTIKKETGSWKWTLLALALPTVLGILLCMLFTAVVRLFS